LQIGVSSLSKLKTISFTMVYLKKNDHAEPSAQRSKALVALEAFHTNATKPMLLSCGSMPRQDHFFK
jgi:hypothetical protein